MKDDASLTIQEKAIRWNRAGGTGSATEFTFFTALHHHGFSPDVFPAMQVRVDGNELKETSKAGNVADVVPPVLTQTASNSQLLKRQPSSSE